MNNELITAEVKERMENFDFDALFVSQETPEKIDWTKPQPGLERAESDLLLEGLRKMKNDMQVAYINYRNSKLQK